MESFEEIRKRILSGKEKEPEKKSNLLSTGLHLLDLCCAGGILPGHYYMFVGDSQAGKSWLLRQIMAEACANPKFDHYDIIDDNPERGTLMDMRRYFGKKFVKRRKPPTPEGHSRSLEQFYDNVKNTTRKKATFYGLDSEDALATETDRKKSDKDKNKRATGKDDEIGGSYGTSKAKLNSSELRIAHNDLEDHDSILIVIKQTRQNIGFTAQRDPKTRSGGLALTFYATLEFWFSIKEKIRKNIRGKNRVIGSILKIMVKKNRASGRDRTIEVPFYPDVGFDDLGSCVNFLVDEGHWTETKGKIDATDFQFKGSHDKLVRYIEESGLERDLRKITTKVWNEIEEACSIARKPRYS